MSGLHRKFLINSNWSAKTGGSGLSVEPFVLSISKTLPFGCTKTSQYKDTKLLYFTNYIYYTEVESILHFQVYFSTVSVSETNSFAAFHKVDLRHLVWKKRAWIPSHRSPFVCPEIRSIYGIPQKRGMIKVYKHRRHCLTFRNLYQ